MSATTLEKFQSAVNGFDLFVRTLPENVGAKEMRDKMQEMSSKVVSAINH
jgi:hypothetical protein